uniref:Digeranylgeranylglyceryl phosphate synthase n=1 Tax=candidate division WOR-3 bacterium TaxID=2052148 RepID=A0A7V3RFW4_UNCW3
MDYFFIIRPLNCAITFISVLCGAWMGKTIIINNQIILAGIIGFLACAFGNVINDIMDIEIDKINNPLRPLASGRAQKNIAVILAIILALLSLLLTILLNLKSLIIVIIATLLLTLYALYFKKTPVANFIVAIVAGLSFIFGGFITNNSLALIAAIFAIFIHTPREIIKDIIDIEGDKKFGVSSLPLILGVEKSVKIAIVFLILLIIFSPVPYFTGFLNIRYLLVIIFGAIPLLVLTIIRIKYYKFASNLLKIIMLLGLGGFIIG